MVAEGAAKKEPSTEKAEWRPDYPIKYAPVFVPSVIVLTPLRACQADGVSGLVGWEPCGLREGVPNALEYDLSDSGSALTLLHGAFITAAN